MATIREMFFNEFIKLLDDYERCNDELIKREIYMDLELLKGVIFRDKMDDTKKENYTLQKDLLKKVREEVGE